MFQALRQGSPIWVMDKSNLSLQVCTVESVTQPTSYNQLAWMQQAMPGQTMDVKVVMEDGTTSEFKQLQPTSVVAQYGNVIVSETQEAMAREIDTLDRQSAAVIDSVTYHQRARTAYEEMKRKLSPTYAKQRDTEDRLHTLENDMGDIKTMLAEALGKKSSKG